MFLLKVKDTVGERVHVGVEPGPGKYEANKAGMFSSKL